jgi:hypothetical protein
MCFIHLFIYWTATQQFSQLTPMRSLSMEFLAEAWHHVGQTNWASFKQYSIMLLWYQNPEKKLVQQGLWLCTTVSPLPNYVSSPLRTLTNQDRYPSVEDLLCRLQTVKTWTHTELQFHRSRFQHVQIDKTNIPYYLVLHLSIKVLVLKQLWT